MWYDAVNSFEDEKVLSASTLDADYSEIISAFISALLLVFPKSEVAVDAETTAPLVVNTVKVSLDVVDVSNAQNLQNCLSYYLKVKELEDVYKELDLSPKVIIKYDNLEQALDIITLSVVQNLADDVVEERMTKAKFKEEVHKLIEQLKTARALHIIEVLEKHFEF